MSPGRVRAECARDMRGLAKRVAACIYCSSPEPAAAAPTVRCRRARKDHPGRRRRRRFSPGAAFCAAAAFQRWQRTEAARNADGHGRGCEVPQLAKPPARLQCRHGGQHGTAGKEIPQRSPANKTSDLPYKARCTDARQKTIFYRTFVKCARACPEGKMDEYRYEYGGRPPPPSRTW